MEKCTLCPRRCGVVRNGKDSAKKQRGFCGETDTVRAARAALHMWEEPCISGEEGSGAVFFTGCTLRCVYCQNFSLSRGETGREISVKRLSEIFLELQDEGANNINLVTPTHFVPQIIEALRQAENLGLHIPIVYNTSGYESVKTLKKLRGLVDIYLPDFKYWEKESARRYSLAEDYPDVAKAALQEMVDQVKAPVFDERGMMKSGVIVRHLLLPGHVTEGEKIVEYLYKTYGDQIYISLMNQYTPLDSLDKGAFPELARKVTKREYDKLVDFAIDLGVENGYIQEGETAMESFIPPFTLNGV